MNADTLYNPTFPHGTPGGFTTGCHGSHCPAVISCRDVHRRYAGDFTFRRMFDAGVTLEAIREHDEETAREAVRADRAARRASARRANAGTPQRRSGGRTRRPFKIDGTPSTPLQHEVVKWHSAGLTDSEIAEKVGKSRDQIRASRRWLQLNPNRAKTAIDHVRELHAQGCTDIEMARRLHKDANYIGTLRRRAGLPLIKFPRTRIDIDQFKVAHAEGLTDRQLGVRFGVDARTAAKRRRRLDLPVNPSPAARGASQSQETT